MSNNIFITIVLYEETWQKIPSAKTLQKLVNQSNFRLLIYDNSQQKQSDPFFTHEGVTYFHDPQNSGLAAAYNHGLSLVSGQELLLLLDQDTKLTLDYALKLAEIDLSPAIGGIVPTVYADQKQISPVLAGNYVSGNWQYPEVGITTDHIMAINSGTAVSVAFMQAIGGFNLDFPLDFLDHWLFFTLYQQKKEILILPDRLQHDLSVLHYETMSLARYRSILKAETFFYQEFEQEKLLRHQKQLFLRMLKQFVTVRNRQIWRMTAKEYQKVKELNK